MKTVITIGLLIACALSLSAEPREKLTNYIIRRQEAYQVQGVPTSRLIIGKREIDIYRAPGGGRLYFERDNLVGISR